MTSNDFTNKPHPIPSHPVITWTPPSPTNPQSIHTHQKAKRVRGSVRLTLNYIPIYLPRYLFILPLCSSSVRNLRMDGIYGWLSGGNMVGIYAILEYITTQHRLLLLLLREMWYCWVAQWLCLFVRFMVAYTAQHDMHVCMYPYMNAMLWFWSLDLAIFTYVRSTYVYIPRLGTRRWVLYGGSRVCLWSFYFSYLRPYRSIYLSIYLMILITKKQISRFCHSARIGCWGEVRSSRSRDWYPHWRIKRRSNEHVRNR